MRSCANADIGRERSAGHQRRQKRGEWPILDKLSLAGTQRIELLHVQHSQNVESVLRDIAKAEADRSRALASTAFFGACGIDADFGTGVVLAGNEVDYATDGVGTVNGRCAVFQHFDPLYCAGRDVIQVDAGVVTRGRKIGQSPAIQQYQGAGDANAT